MEEELFDAEVERVARPALGRARFVFLARVGVTSTAVARVRALVH